MKKFFLLVWIVSLLLSASIVSAQASSDAPYLYYYSRMLGGLIIEHPDGSDSRLIGADVIPPNLTGISGPGWSPSGKYFAAYGVATEADWITNTNAYLMDMQGRPVKNFPSLHIGNWPEALPARIQWSPAGENLVLVISQTADHFSTVLTFLVFDASAEQTLVTYSGVFESDVAFIIRWETNRQQLQIYSHTRALNDARYYQVAMQFDGTVLKKSVSETEFEHNTPQSTPVYRDPRISVTMAQGISPSGRYEVTQNRLHNNITGEDVLLPTHSQGTICRDYRWSEQEDYILTLDGTAVAGGGCGLAVLGITDNQGRLWRELGGCYWTNICAGWLPAWVDVNMLPSA